MSDRSKMKGREKDWLKGNFCRFVEKFRSNPSNDLFLGLFTFQQIQSLENNTASRALICFRQNAAHLKMISKVSVSHNNINIV